MKESGEAAEWDGILVRKELARQRALYWLHKICEKLGGAVYDDGGLGMRG
jgi:hypothetical protein